jgi:hypothetical protein
VEALKSAGDYNMRRSSRGILSCIQESHFILHAAWHRNPMKRKIIRLSAVPGKIMHLNSVIQTLRKRNQSSCLSGTHSRIWRRLQVLAKNFHLSFFQIYRWAFSKRVGPEMNKATGRHTTPESFLSCSFFHVLPAACQVHDTATASYYDSSGCEA